MEFLGFSVCNMPSENRDSFTSSFKIWMHFLPFSYLVVMARTFNTLLNKSGENGHPSLVPLRENTFILSPLNMILIVGLSHTAFIVLRHVLFLPTAAKSLQSCPTPSNPMDRSPPGPSVHGIFQARVLEWGAIAFSKSLYLV